WLVHDRRRTTRGATIVGARGFARYSPIAVVAVCRRAFRCRGVAASVEHDVIDAGCLDVTGCHRVTRIELAYQLAVPIAVPRRGRASHPGGRAGQDVLSLFLAEERRAVGVVQIGFIVPT